MCVCGDRLVAPLGLFSRRSLQLVVPAILYSGVSQGFYFGDFPPLIGDRQWKFFVMACFGAADVASSVHDPTHHTQRSAAHAQTLLFVCPLRF